MKRLLLISFATSFVAYMSGCSFLTRDIISAPQAKGSSGKHEMFSEKAMTHLFGGRSDIEFQFQEFDIAVAANNRQYVVLSGGIWIFPVVPWPPAIVSLFLLPQKRPPPLWIELIIRPKVKNVSFEPMEVLIETEEGMSSPLGFLDPVGGSWHPRRWPCDWHVAGGSSIRYRDISTPLNIERKTCIRVAFNLDPNPSNPFTLLLPGIKTDSGLHTIPKIHFKKDTEWILAIMF